MELLPFGIVGCGGRGAQVMYGPILRFLREGRAVAACDPDPEALAIMQRLYGIPRGYTSFGEFLRDEGVPAVVIASPVYAHAEQVVEAARAGRHVLVEKPMARSVAECDAMIAACRAAGVLLMVGFMKRFDKSFIRATELIRSGRLGRVHQVRCEWSWCGWPRSGWRDSAVTRGGQFQDHGSHTVDLCRWWLGEVRRVTGDVAILSDDREVEDRAVAVLEHSGGGISLHHMTHGTHKPYTEYYLIDGDRASLELSHGLSYVSTEPFRMRLYEGGDRVTDVTPAVQRNLDMELAESGRYRRELDHFLACVRGRSTPAVTGGDGRAAIEIINAAYVSCWRGQKVALPLSESPDLEAFFAGLCRERDRRRAPGHVPGAPPR